MFIRFTSNLSLASAVSAWMGGQISDDGRHTILTDRGPYDGTDIQREAIASLAELPRVGEMSEGLRWAFASMALETASLVADRHFQYTQLTYEEGRRRIGNHLLREVHWIGFRGDGFVIGNEVDPEAEDIAIRLAARCLVQGASLVFRQLFSRLGNNYSASTNTFEDFLRRTRDELFSYRMDPAPETSRSLAPEGKTLRERFLDWQLQQDRPRWFAIPSGRNVPLHRVAWEALSPSDQIAVARELSLLVKGPLR